MSLLRVIEEAVYDATLQAELRYADRPEFVILDKETYDKVLAEDKEMRYLWPVHTQRDTSKGDLFMGLQVAVLMEVKERTIKVR